MNCRICQDRGLVRLLDDNDVRRIGICLCAEGQKLRSDKNAGKSTGYPLWNAWAASAGIPFDRIAPIETLAETDGFIGITAEGRECFLSEIPVGDSVDLSAVARVQTRRPRL